MKMKLKSQKIHSIKELWDMENKYFTGAMGKSLLAAGWRPTKKQAKKYKNAINNI